MDPFKPYQARPRTMVAPPLSEEDAAAVALQAMAFMVADEALLTGFVTLTGCGLDDIKARLTERWFQAAVLDFLLADESALVAFAESAGLSPEVPSLARRRLAPE